MAWIALIAALQDVPTRWDFKAGSWVDMTSVSTRAENPTPRVYREEFQGGPRRPLAAFSDGLKEASRRAEEWHQRPCTVIEYKDDTRIATAWVVEGLKIPAREMPGSSGSLAVPPNVVRAILVEKRMNAVYASRIDVLELSAPVEIAGRTFDCVLETGSMVQETETSVILRSKRHWLSAEVPGHVVRQERQCTGNPQAVPHDYTTREELKAFHVER